jgi:hypothetical protein
MPETAKKTRLLKDATDAREDAFRHVMIAAG